MGERERLETRHIRRREKKAGRKLIKAWTGFTVTTTLTISIHTEQTETRVNLLPFLCIHMIHSPFVSFWGKKRETRNK